LFKIFDKDGDGEINRKDLGSLLEAFHEHPSDAQLALLIDEIDEEGTGTINFDEFLKFMVVVKKKHLTDHEWYKMFTMFDQDDDGFVKTHELYAVLKYFMKDLTMEEAEEILEYADHDKDGKLHFKEFIALVKNPPTDMDLL
jgi:calmodulin